MGHDSQALLPRLLEAALRSIAGNGIGVVGRDGRHFFCMEAIVADGALAALLREVVGKLPAHNATCAARVSKISACNCSLLDEIKGNYIFDSLRVDRLGLPRWRVPKCPMNPKNCRAWWQRTDTLRPRARRSQCSIILASLSSWRPPVFGWRS